MSSEKHPNLQLNKWTPSDYVKMAEFNENFKKIDDKAKEITDAKMDYDGVAHADLPERLTADFGKVTAQLADIAYSEVNVKEKNYGAVGNANYFKSADNKFYVDAGFTQLAADDTESFRSAFNEANSKGSTLIIPNGEYFIQPNALIEIKCQVVCLGTIKTLNSGSNSTFVIKKDSDNTIIQGSTITTTLSKGLTYMPEVSSYKGYGLVLNSTEKLIDRDLEAEPFYTKNEPCKILQTGYLEKGLTVDYTNKSVLNLTLIPMDKKVTVQLKVKSYGSKDTGRVIVLNYRSNVILDLYLEDTTQDGHEGLMNLNAFDVTMNGTIIGFNEYGIGYGVVSSYCYNLHFNMNISMCRHCITGRHNRLVFIDSGTYVGDKNAPIDDHWGADYYINNARIAGTQNSGSIFAFAGFGDFSVSNCKIEMENEYVFSVRGDTPHFDGTFEMKDCFINHKTSSGIFMGYKLPSSIKSFGGVVLKNPKIIMKNIDIDFNNNASGYKQLFLMGLVTSDAHNSVLPKDITTDNINFINCNSDISLMEFYYYDNKRIGDIKLTAKNVTADNGFDLIVNFTMDNKSIVTPNNRFSFELDRLGDVKLTLDAFGIIDSIVSKSTLTQIYPVSTSRYVAGNIYDSSPNKAIRFIDCEMNCNGLSVFMLANYEFSNSHFLPVNTAFYTLAGNNMSSLTIKRVKGCSFDAGSIADSTIGRLLYNKFMNPSTEITERNIGYRINAGSPIGAVIPKYTGEELLDTSNKVWYKSSGLTNTDWVKNTKSNVGVVTYNGDGTTLTKTIPHGLSVTPAFYQVIASSSDAGTADIKYVLADATNLTVTFKAAPISGTNNVRLTWKAEV